MELIDKSALVAEIERQQRKLCLLSQSNEVELRKDAAVQNGVYCYLLSFLDTLEVKEVDNGCTKLDSCDTISPLAGGMPSNVTISVVDYNGEKWVRVQALGEDFIIAPRNLDDSEEDSPNKKEFDYNEAMERLEELGLDTFNRKQGFIIAIYINEINAKLSEIGGDPMGQYAYVSNELCNVDGSVGEYSAYHTWYFNGYSRFLYYYCRYYSYFRCRPCISYSNLKN